MTFRASSIYTSACSVLAKYKLHSGLLALCFVLGLSSAALEAGLEVEQTGGTNNWTLPTIPTVRLTSSIENMLSDPLFGGKPFIPEPEVSVQEDVTDEKSVEWKLVGIIFEGTIRSALIENQETGELEDIQMGALLPGGELLEQIDENSIVVKKDDESLQMSLFVDTSDAALEPKD